MTYSDGIAVPKVGDTVRSNHSGTNRVVRAVSDNGMEIDHDGTPYIKFVPAENWRLMARGPILEGPSRRFSRVFREKGIRVTVYADITEATSQEHVADALLNACSEMRQVILDAMRPKEPTELGAMVTVEGGGGGWPTYVLVKRRNVHNGEYLLWTDIDIGRSIRHGHLPAGWAVVGDAGRLNG